MSSFFIKTLGCKVNSFDSQSLKTGFLKASYQEVKSHKEASFVVINSCSVTEAAEKEVFYWIRRYRRENTRCKLIVTGCSAQINSEKLLEKEAVDLVIPNEAKSQLISYIEDLLDEKAQKERFPKHLKAVRDNKQKHFKSSAILFETPQLSERTRSFVKIQDGCNGFCAYCQIPLARGASKSALPSEALASIEALLDQGVPEIVLTGIHLGDYGRDLTKEELGWCQDQKQPFVSFLARLFTNPKLKRLRLSSFEPSELSSELVELLAKNREKVCDHFHLPLQSGSDRILKLMGRHYTKEKYLRACQLIRNFFPDSQISADVIPGFPSESENDFKETIDFIKDCQLNSLHVFPYSKRPNTRALRMPGHLDANLVKQRAQNLRSLSEELFLAYKRRFIGRDLKVLWEKKTAAGEFLGKSRNYLQLRSRAGCQELALAGENVMQVKGFLPSGELLAVEK